jgi:hypothetical protein
MKKVLVGVAAVLVVVAIAVFYLSHNLGRVLKAGIETFAPRFTQTAVTVESVDLSPSTGAGTVRGLVIGNPAPYREPHAFRLGEASVTIDPASIMSEKVVVRSVRVTGPEVTFEGGLTDNNLKALVANLNRFADSEKSKSPEETGSKKKLQVDEFVLTGTRVTVRLDIPGVGDVIPPITLPDIRLANLGSGPDGITPAELTRQVLGAVIKQVLPAVAAKATNLPKNLGGAAKDAAEKGAGAIKDAAKGLDKLFKK